jgi:Amt family ammonium transporter
MRRNDAKRWSSFCAGLVEAGLTRAKNVANIMMKNLMDMSAGVLAFLLVGFGIGFGTTEWFDGWFG